MCVSSPPDLKNRDGWIQISTMRPQTHVQISPSLGLARVSSSWTWLSEWHIWPDSHYAPTQLKRGVSQQLNSSVLIILILAPLLQFFFDTICSLRYHQSLGFLPQYHIIVCYIYADWAEYTISKFKAYQYVILKFVGARILSTYDVWWPGLDGATDIRALTLYFLRIRKHLSSRTQGLCRAIRYFFNAYQKCTSQLLQLCKSPRGTFIGRNYHTRLEQGTPSRWL
jgi:hypothetical protein